MAGLLRYAASMNRKFDQAPGAAEIEAIARASLRALPEPFAAHLADVVLTVEEFADDATLADLGIDDPFDLTGLYHGLPVGEKSVERSGDLPDRITLYRRAILDEWAQSGESLEHLVHHILVHEVGHHFGLSDEDMHRLEEEGP
jgi:predicted Zn-dependent protease with MMP-like domain